VSVVQRFYDTNAEKEWARLTFAREPHRWLEFRVALHLMDKYLPSPPVRVLDVGSGPGRYAIALATKGYRVTLFDLSGESLALARRNVADAGVGDRVEGYEQGTATDLSCFADSYFDAVLVMGPLYHLVTAADRLATVRESLRILRPGGIVMATIINHLGVARSAPTEFPDWLDTPDCLNIVRSYTQIVEEADHAFTTAYFAHPLDLRCWYQDAGAETVSMAAQEGVAGGLLEQCRRLAENSVAWQNWVQIVLETCEDPTILGGSEHTLYVGRKRGS
jgi:S-adenosylmethionine-dependent methyltransferase